MATCFKCGKEVKNKDDANIIAFLGIVPRLFCNQCYSSKEKGIGRHFAYFPTYPLNSVMYIISLFILTILFIIIFFLVIKEGFTDWSSQTIGFIMILLVFSWFWGLWIIAKRKISNLK